MNQALVLLAHGARNPNWAAPFEQVAAQLAASQPKLPVRLAFLELMAPDLGTVLRALAQEGIDRVDVMPMFLGGSGHVLRDIPPLLDAARQELGLDIHLHTALGQQPGMVDAMAAVCLSVIRERAP